MKQIFPAGLIAALFLLFTLTNCGDPSVDRDAESSTSMSSGFRLVTADQSGIQFTNVIQETIEFNFLNYPYIYNGGGVAAADFNMDGRTDIFFTANQRENKLYLNKGKLKFEDATGKAGLTDAGGWTTGAAVCDINGDGYPDIYVCKSGSLNNAAARKNKLYVNKGDGTFNESAAEYGLADAAFSTQAYFIDYDKDGDADMYLVNHRPDFRNNSKISTAIQQDVSPETSDKLYRNDGGRFTEVTSSAGITNKTWGLSAAIGDFNDDGWDDIYVCNDFLEPDHLWINNGNGTFTDRIHGVMDHISFYSMGSDFADINNDDRPDLVVLDMVASDHVRSKRNMAAMSNEMFRTMVNVGYHHQYMSNALQLNNGNGDFSEIGNMAGIAKTDWSWAPLLADLNNDGYRDLYITNGIKRDITDNDYKNELIARNQAGESMTLDQVFDLVPAAKIRNEFFMNRNGLQFDRKTSEMGLDQNFNSNGAAYADLDGDGDLDLILNNMDDAAAIYENLSGGNYLSIRLDGPPENPMGIGATIEIQSGENHQSARQFLCRGFQSSIDPILHFGLSNANAVETLVITWPDGKIEVQDQVAVNREITLSHSNSTLARRNLNNEYQLFKKIKKLPSGLNFKHAENNFDDFTREILLPQKQSTLGPAIAVSDVNNDGLDDIFIGNAKGRSSAMFIQGEDGAFTRSNKSIWEHDKTYEDVAAVFFDADGDGDPDLYVVSGGNESEASSPDYEDRLYINNGLGSFGRDYQALPPTMVSGGCAVPGDFDADGDLDLFIGGRTVPGKYPFSPPSYLLFNEGGKFREPGDAWKAAVSELGMVNDAVTTDYDMDADKDIIAVGEWMEVTILENTGDGFKQADILENSSGWWFSIEASDMDGDGDEDYVLGNLGLNNKFHPSADKPFHVYAADFDNSGNIDIVLSKEGKNEMLPVRGRECSSQQMPFITEKFPTYGEFAEASLDEIYGEAALEDALHLQVETFASSYMENMGDGSFALRELPVEAQTGPSLNFILEDINNDGAVDIIGAGNIYNAEVETIRYDASKGYVLLGDGSGAFTALPNSGLMTSGNVKDLVSIDINGTECIAVAVNNGPLELFRLK